MDAVHAGGGACDEGGLVREVVQPPVGVGAGGQFRGECCRQGGAHARHPQELPRVHTQTVEDLDRQVLGDRALVSREVREKAGRIVRVAQGQRRETEPRGPPFRAGMQHGDLRRRQLQAGGLHESGGVVEGETQDVCAQFVEPALEPESGIEIGGSVRLARTSRRPAGPRRTSRVRSRKASRPVSSCTSSRTTAPAARVRPACRRAPPRGCPRAAAQQVRRAPPTGRPRTSRATPAGRSARPTRAAGDRCRPSPARSRPSRRRRWTAPSPSGGASYRIRPAR